MIAVETLSPEAASAYASLTFPARRDLVTAPPADREMVFVGAAAEGEPVGFAFGMGGPEGQFEVISFYVTPFYRGRGLSRALLEALESAFVTRGYRMGVHFFTVDAEDQAYARFLLNNGWSRPTLRQVVCTTDLAHAYQTPWLVRARVPKNCEVRRWREVSETERATLRARKEAEPGFYPDGLDPFFYEADCHEDTSLALLKDEAVVGWVITHVLDERTLRWTCSYVTEALQGSGRMLPLWWEVAQRQKRHTGLDRFIYTAPVDQPRMVRFALRRMRPWLLSLGYACVTTKPLGPAA